MKDLIENVFSENFVVAQKVFESRMQEIMEKKLHEMKKDLQSEAFGGLTKDEIEARRKAGYRKASEVLPDPRGKEKLSPATRKLRGIKTVKKVSVKKKKINEGLTDDLKKAAKEGMVRTAAKTARAIGKTYAGAKEKIDIAKYHAKRVPGELKKSTERVLKDPLKAAGQAGSAIKSGAKAAYYKASDVAKSDTAKAMGSSAWKGIRDTFGE